MACPYLNELKNRGVKDILILCADGLSGMKEAIASAFPQTEYQRCIVHQVRNTLKYVPDKDRKLFANDLKSIYQAPDETKALEALTQGYRKMVGKIPKCHEKLGEKLGCYLAHFQVFIYCPEGDLYHKRDREPECYIPEAKPSKKRISQ